MNMCADVFRIHWHVNMAHYTKQLQPPPRKHHHAHAYEATAKEQNEQK